MYFEEVETKQMGGSIRTCVDPRTASLAGTMRRLKPPLGEEYGE
jgi:hypothetical protein